MGWGSLGSQAQIAVRLMLLGGPEYVGKLKAAAGATTSLAKATFVSGQAMRTASKNTWLQNQALYTFRRYAFFGTLAVTALAIGVVKLGYSYLATRDSARAALKPIFQDQQRLNNELDRLFTLSKYSPFVLKDMTDALRVMYPSLHGAGLGVSEMNQLLLSMTNILSQSGRTTPRALAQISYAIQHMLYQGRLTGRLTQSLAAAGVPVPELLARLGYAHANLSSIARLNISPQNVIKALTEMGQEGIFKNAAQRVALRSFPGMLQVLQDSLSKLIGTFSEGTYNRVKANMFSLVGPGGFLDRLGNAKNGTQAILMLSNALTGSGAAGKGLLMLLGLLKQLVVIFTTGVIPAFGIALAVLLPFAAALWPLNVVLGFLADNIWIVKYALVPLAAWFIITHTAMLGLWITSKLLTIAMFGETAAVKKLAIILFTTAGRMRILNTLTRLWIVLTKGEILVTTFYGVVATKSYTSVELAVIRARTAVIAMGLAARGSWLAMLGPIGLVIAGLILIIKYHNQIKDSFSGGHGVTGVGTRLVGGAGGGGQYTGGGIAGNFLSAHLGVPGSITGAHKVKQPNAIAVGAVDPVANFDQWSESQKTVVHQLVVDRKVLAEAVARENQDRQARR